MYIFCFTGQILDWHMGGQGLKHEWPGLQTNLLIDLAVVEVKEEVESYSADQQDNLNKDITSCEGEVDQSATRLIPAKHYH